MSDQDQHDQDVYNLLAAIVEQARALAARMAGDPEHVTPCHFCGGPLAMWENVLVLQLAGVPAHVECPADILRARLAEVGPLQDFPYDDFSAAVDRRLAQEQPPPSQAGVIEC